MTWGWGELNLTETSTIQTRCPKFASCGPGAVYIIVKPMLSTWQLSISWRANRRSIPLYLYITPCQELTLCTVLTLHKGVNRSWDIGAKRHCLLALLVLNFQCRGSPLLHHMIWVTRTTSKRLVVKFILGMPSSAIQNSVLHPSQN